MMKWLRLHSKKIMVAVVLLAMFSFIGGSALVSLMSSDPGKVVAMSAFGRDYTFKEQSMARSDTEVLDALLISWKIDSDRGFNARHWLLLAEEAERAGIVVADEEVEKVIQLQEEQRQRYNLGPLDILRTSRGISRPMIRSAVRRQLMIVKNAERVIRAGMPSEPQLRHYVHDTEEKVKVSYVTLDAKKYSDPTETVSDEEAQAQFEAYKSVFKDESESGFGYKLPQRVKAQYAMAPIQRIQQNVEVSFNEIKEYWKKNRTSYKKTEWVDEPQPATTQPAGSQPASQPEPKRTPVEKEKSFSEAQVDVERDLRKRKSHQLATRAMRRLGELLAAPWSSLPADPKTGYKPIPEEVKSPDYFKKLTEQVSKELNVELVYSETPMSSREQLRANPDLGSAVTPGEGEEPLTLPEYAFRVPTLYSVPEDHATTLRLQLFQAPMSPLTISARGGYQFRDGRLIQMPGETENYVLFRVVEAVEAGVPKEMSEVRSEIDSDIRLKRAFQKIEPIARQLYVVATRVGLNASLPIFPAIGAKMQLTAPATTPLFSLYSRLPSNEIQTALEANKPTLRVSSVPGVGESEAFVKASFDLASPDWKSAEVSMPETEAGRAATTQPALVPTPHVAPVSDLKLQKWFVIQLVEHQAVNTEQYQDKHRQTAFSALMGERATALRNQWYSPQQIDIRCSYIDRTPEGGVQMDYPVRQPLPPPEF